MERDVDGTQPHQLDRRAMLRKLMVGGSVAMAGPMIARRASALMPPSQCVNGAELNWSEIFPNTNPAGPDNGPLTLLDVDGSGVDITISSTFAGTTPLAGNYNVVASPHGGITGKSLLLEQNPVANTPSGGTAGAGGQTVTITFSTTVRNISFVLTDIDNQEDSWSDRVTTTGGTLTPPNSVNRPATVIGIGDPGNGTGGNAGNQNSGNGGSNTATGAYRHSSESNNLENSSGAGNLRMNWTGPISVVRFRYWCGGVGGGSNQLIRLGNISFDTCPEGITPNFAPVQPRQQAEELEPATDDFVTPLPGYDS